MKILNTFAFVCIFCFRITAQDLVLKDWPHLKGYWKFQNSKDFTKATVGNKLILVGSHQLVAGASYGDTATRIAIGSYYKYAHAIAPNGGGDSVNQYTLMFDFKVLNFKRWHTFFQTDTANANDGECFIRPITSAKPARIGTATTGYTPDSINANQWYRLVISVNLNNFYRYYLNGKLVLEGDTQEVDGRFALLPQILFFADNDKEDDTIDIASLAIFDTCLSSKDILKIGTIDPCVVNPPKVNLGRDTTLCANNTIGLSAGFNFINYQWSTGNKLPFELIDANLGIGKNTVWVKVTDRNGCIVADTIQINFLALPGVDLGKDTAFCKGQKIKLTAGTNLTNKYLWKIMPKGISLSSSNTLTTDSSGKYMVQVIATTGCQNTDTITITVNKNPVKPKINIIGNTSLCKGDSVKLEGPGSFKEYSWSNGYKLQHLYLKTSSNLTLKVKDQNGCESPVSDTIKVVVHNIPSAPIIQYKGSAEFCEGDSLILTATPGFAQYIWQDGIGKAIRVVTKATIYNVYAKDSNNCISSVSNSVFVNVLPSPPKPFISISGKTILCDGETTLLSVTQSSQAYLWTDSIKTRDNTISKSGTYGVKIFNNNACPSPWSDKVNIIVNPIPAKPKVIFVAKDSLKSSILAGQYKWFRNNQQLPDTMLTIYSSHSGFFQVQIANKNCWSPLSDTVNYKNLGISREGINSHELRIYPNPVTDKVYYYINYRYASGEIWINLYDTKGKIIRHERLLNSELGDVNSLNMEGLPAGVYLLKISADGLDILGKVMKY